MSKDYGKLWKDIIRITDEGKAVRTLAEILADKEGRAFASRLGREDAELCIEILDHVCRDLYLLPSPVVSDNLSGHRRARAQHRGEAGFLHHVEETHRMLWAVTGFHDNN